jgi:tetratricopeptide (TPR) repeat protein
MNRNPRSLVLILGVAVLALVSAGCNKLKARDELNKGVAAFKGGQYDSAIEHFMKAKEFDPELLNARLYLATAYASQYIPGAPSEDNVRNGQKAIEEFQEVLKVDPANLSAIDGIGSILFQMGGAPYEPKKFAESREYHQKHIQVKPDDPEPYYWVGVINWTLAFRANGEMRIEYRNQNPSRPLKEDQPLPTKLREGFAAEYEPVVDEGIDHLKKAMERRADYEDAMAYLNLLYRQKADMVASPQEREQYLDMADELVDRVKAIKQKKMEGPAPTT